jgi:hypothetical protein
VRPIVRAARRAAPPFSTPPTGRWRNAAALRAILGRRVADAERIETPIAAIDGAICRRLLLGEPPDQDFARRLAALAPAA